MYIGVRGNVRGVGCIGLHIRGVGYVGAHIRRGEGKGTPL